MDNQPKDGIAETDLKTYVTAAHEIAEGEADAHYAALYAAFLEAVPAFLHRTGEYAPSPKRTPGFSADAVGYHFYLNFGEEYAQTSAVFKFKKKLAAWRLRFYLTTCMISPFQCEQCMSKTLPAAILTARELWLAHHSGKQALQPIAQLAGTIQ